LQFLDDVSDRAIVALGEGTHGSSEFFKAKHRMFRYLVENHGYKIFAIEADFGESVFINRAVLNSDKNQIESLMKEKMIFWTWRTNEVRDLLYWMCDYNVGKAEDQKVQYWGIDCQFNTHNPDLVMDYLVKANVPFIPFAESILDEAEEETSHKFSAYDQVSFDTYLEKVVALKDSLIKYETNLIDAGSEKEYQLTLQLVDEIKQVSEVVYYTREGATKNYRDITMAENTRWLREYFNGAKIVLWAHNFHVSVYPRAGTLGHQLKTVFGEDYVSIGFLFAKGTFTALTQTGDQYFGPKSQSLEADPKPGSMNDVMSRARVPAYSVRISDLQNHPEWIQALAEGIEFFQMGSAYNNKPSDYYEEFSATYFDQLIYFDHTTASVPVQ